MQEELKKVDYIPRKCFATNKILNAKDKGSVQINFSDSQLTRDKKAKPLTVVLSGFVRSKAGADAAVNRYLRSQGVLSFE